MQSEGAHRVMYDGLYTFGVRVLRILLTVGLGILTARVLGPAGRGQYALPGVESALVASAFGGLASATSYFLLNRKLNARFLRPVLVCGLLLTVFAAVAAVVLTYLAGQRWAALPAISVLPSLALVSIASGYAIGVKKVRYPTALATAQTIFTIAATVLGFVLFSGSPGVAIAAWIAGTTATGVVCLVYVLTAARRELNGDESVGFGEYVRFSLKVSLVSVVSLLNYRADLYIVALFLSQTALGMYTIAVAGAESLLIPTQVAALVTSPHIGSLDVRSAGVLTARCVRHNLLIAILVCGVLFVFARPLVALMYGRSFLPLVPAFDILLAGVFALSLSSPVANYFTLKLGRPQVALWLSSISATVCIVTTLLLIRQLGMSGAAIGSTAGYVVAQAIALWYFARHSGVGARAIFVPTGNDLSVYRAFAGRLLRDSRRLLRPVP